jgi:hypothetical protein
MKTWLVLAGLCCSGVAMAADKVDRGHGFFFNRPGATGAAMLADLESCRQIASGAQSQINGVNVLFGGLGAVIGGAFAGKRLQRINVENCMLVRGWRLFAMTDAEGDAFNRQPIAAQRTALDGLAGSETPAIGTLLRHWHNDYAEPAFFEKKAK